MFQSTFGNLILNLSFKDYFGVLGIFQPTYIEMTNAIIQILNWILRFL